MVLYIAENFMNIGKQKSEEYVLKSGT